MVRVRTSWGTWVSSSASSSKWPLEEHCSPSFPPARNPSGNCHQNQVLWLLYMQFPVPSWIEFCWRGKLLFFKFWSFFTFLQKTTFLSPGTLGTAIFDHCIQGVITWGCTKRIRGLGSQTHQERVNWDSSEWKSRGNMTVLLNYTKICCKKKGILFSVQITSEREQEVGLNLELERLI